MSSRTRSRRPSPSVHRRLGDAPIRDYVPVPVEREAIDSLKARTGARGGGPVQVVRVRREDFTRPGHYGPVDADR